MTSSVWGARASKASTFRRAIQLLLLQASFAPILAHAQSAGAPPTDSGGGIEQVVVTAERRSENLINVPSAVVMTTAEDLRQNGVKSLSDLSQVVPGLRIDMSGAVAQPTIRGVSGSIAGPAASSTVAVYIDGFLRPDGIGLDSALSDVSSIQTLKGPQGTLFGRNTTGGAILIQTREPSFDYAADARLSYGNYNESSGSLFLTGPLTDNLAASISLYENSSDGFNYNIFRQAREGNYNKAGGRAKLLFRLSDKTEFKLEIEHLYVNDPNPLVLQPYKGQTDGALSPGVIIATGRGYVAADTPSQQSVELNGVYLTQKYDLGSVLLTSYTGYHTIKQGKNTLFDLDATNIPVDTTRYPGQDNIFTQEFQFNNADSNDRLQWVAGAFYMNEAASQPLLQGSTTVGGGNWFPIISSRQTIHSYAGYGDLTYGLTDRLFLSIGARYSSDYLDADRAFPPDFTWQPKLTTTFGQFDYRGVLRYQIDDNSSVYVSFNKGSKGGTFNPTGGGDAAVRPEEIKAYEAGYKAIFGDILVELAGFYYDYSNLQVSSYGPGYQIVSNAASAELYGFDPHLKWDVSENFDFDIGATALHSKYTSFPGAIRYLFSPTVGIEPVVEDAAGHPLIRAPEFSGTLSATYHHDLEHGRFAVTGSYSYQSKVDFDSFGDMTQGGYGLLNARVEWTTPDERWSIAAYGRNLTDTVYYNQGLQAGLANLVTYGWPRTYGVELAIRY
ncbi:MAG TPA: TonB-dependent receptor [Rhizomicrobium sp.]